MIETATKPREPYIRMDGTRRESFAAQDKQCRTALYSEYMKGNQKIRWEEFRDQNNAALKTMRKSSRCPAMTVMRTPKESQRIVIDPRKPNMNPVCGRMDLYLPGSRPNTRKKA